MGSPPSDEITPSRADQVGTWAGTLALAEVGLGSFMHAAHIPLTGTMLSLNQGLFLARVTKLNRDLPGVTTLGFEISAVTALLKSFSPVGKKLTPMLAIGVQGFLFSIGTMTLGANLAGVVIGSILLSVWGIVQPAILAGIMISTLNDAEWLRIQNGWQKLVSEVDFLQSFNLTTALLTLASIKCTIAAILGVIAWTSSTGDPKSLIARWEAFLNRRVGMRPVNLAPQAEGVPRGVWSNIKMTIRDLSHPVVWLSIILMCLLSFFIDSKFIHAIWIGLRALASIFIVYLLLRLLPWDRMLNPENKHARALRSAILVIQGRRQIDPAPTTRDASESDK